MTKGGGGRRGVWGSRHRSPPFNKGGRGGFLHHDTLRLALIQLDSRTDVAANLATCLRLIAHAARRGAQLIALPENALYIGPDRRLCFARGAPEIAALCAAARRAGAWLLVGSIPERLPHGRRANTALLIDARGQVRARYRKIHQFRARLPHGWVRERGIVAGTRPVVARTPWGGLGLTICYDLRMPELFGVLARRGATLLAVPSNFTAFTGRAHWHTLLRARAIENQAFVLAPAQCGRKYHTSSYGHSLIIDPWGTILAEARTARPQVLVRTIDLQQVAVVRRRLPALLDRHQALRTWQSDH